MGIRGLSTFVDLNHQLLSEHKLHDTRVIIDGNNLYHFLWNHYKVSQQFGGDYDHFARKCKLFFNALGKCRVIPYVVFDGGYDPNDRKLPTILERMKKRILAARMMSRNGCGNVMPILAQETFRQVLVEMQVAHVSCQYEADREIAVLANRWKCPVMSNDSDFFVFGLEGGFLPFDYVNLTLCVCDAETGKASVLDHGKPLTEHQFVYVPVKLYRYERFAKYYCQNLTAHILPVLATVLGNDYIDIKLLEGFYAQLHVPKKKQKFAVPKLNTRMLSVLKWLDSVRDVEKALQNVLIHLPRDKREKIRELLVESIEGYSDLEHFIGPDLQKFFESSEVGTLDVADLCLEMRDFFSAPLPDWFVAGSRKCAIPGHLQNIAVLHRILRLCQVEVISEPSTYLCSQAVNEVICALVFGHHRVSDDSADSGDISMTTRQTCLVQYDRDKLSIKKVYVKPAEVVSGFSPLPNLNTLPEYSKDERFKLLLSALGLTEELIAQSPSLEIMATSNIEKGPVYTKPFSMLLVAIVCHWVRNATPKISHHHVHSLLIGVITLHVRSLKWLDKKAALGASPVIPYLASEMEVAYRQSTEKQLNNFVGHVDKFFTNPDHSVKNPRENLVVHGFSQFQACLYDTVHLNQLLLTPSEPPSPSLILNSTFAYNLCRDLQTRVNPDLYLMEILVSGSPLHELFLMLKNAVLGICDSSVFEVKQSPASSQKKSKSKGRKKGKIVPKEVKELSDSEDADESNDLMVNCDINNKFALLNMEA